MTDIELKASASRIRAILSKASRYVIDIGRELRAVQKGIEEGKFREWLNAEFEWSHVTAYHYMRAADLFGEHEELLPQFDASSLIMLSKRNIDDRAVSRCIKRAQDGERVSHCIAAGIIREYGDSLILVPRLPKDPAIGSFLNKVRTYFSRWSDQIAELQDEDKAQVLRFLLKFAKEELGYRPEKNELEERIVKYLAESGTARARIIAIDLGADDSEVESALVSGPFVRSGNGYYSLNSEARARQVPSRQCGIGI